MAKLTVGDFEDLQGQLLRTREVCCVARRRSRAPSAARKARGSPARLARAASLARRPQELCSSQARERAAAHELGRVRTELADLTLYSNLQATRESLLREDLARLHHALERVTGSADAANAASAAGGGVGDFPAPPTPLARRRVERHVHSAAAQIALLEVERDVLRAALASSDEDERSAAEHTQALLGHVAHSRAEAHRLHALVRERERALLEARQLAATLHVRVSRSDCAAAAERESLSAAATSSSELGAAYREAQRVAASQHAAIREQLRALKRDSARRMVRAASDGTARAALRGWRHAVERSMLLRQLKDLTYRALAQAGAARGKESAAQPEAGVQAVGWEAAEPGASEGGGEAEAGARHTAAAAPGGTPPSARPPSYADKEEVVRAQRLRRWWGAELSVLASSLADADEACARACAAGARQACVAAATEAALRQGLQRSALAEQRAAACACVALGALADADALIDASGARLRESACARSLAVGALADADATLRERHAAALAAEQAVEDGRVEGELRTRRADGMVRELQRSLRDEVAAHARAQRAAEDQRTRAEAAEEAAQARAQKELARADEGGSKHEREDDGVMGAREGAEPGAAKGGSPRGPSSPVSPAPGSLARALNSFLSASVEQLARAEMHEGGAGKAVALAGGSSGSGAWGAPDPAGAAGAADAGSGSGAHDDQASPRAQGRTSVGGLGSSSWFEVIGLAAGVQAAPSAAAATAHRGYAARGAGGATATFVALAAPPRAPASGAVSLPISAESLLLKLRHLSAQNAHLRERASYLEGCVAELQTDLAKKRNLMCARSRPGRAAPPACARLTRTRAARPRPALRPSAGGTSTLWPTGRSRPARARTCATRWCTAGCRRCSSRRWASCTGSRRAGASARSPTRWRSCWRRRCARICRCRRTWRRSARSACGCAGCWRRATSSRAGRRPRRPAALAGCLRVAGAGADWPTPGRTARAAAGVPWTRGSESTGGRSRAGGTGRRRATTRGRSPTSHLWWCESPPSLLSDLPSPLGGGRLAREREGCLRAWRPAHVRR